MGSWFNESVAHVSLSDCFTQKTLWFYEFSLDTVAGLGLRNPFICTYCRVHSFFFYKNVVFPSQAEYSYFSADFRL